MKKPVQRYRAIYSQGHEMQEVEIEAKSDKGAARIAAALEFDRRGFATLRLEGMVRWSNQSYAWLGSSELDELVPLASHWKPRVPVLELAHVG